ncbi:hypothetical protein CKA32_001283 [Geitlerinema sp. FC II]|nr:hypothetical protein CKA32_001283 [Geitlerinema sp. FC II]
MLGRQGQQKDTWGVGARRIGGLGARNIGSLVGWRRTLAVRLFQGRVKSVE